MLRHGSGDRPRASSPRAPASRCRIRWQGTDAESPDLSEAAPGCRKRRICRTAAINPDVAAPAGRRIIHRRPIAKGRTGHRKLQPRLEAAVKALQQFRGRKGRAARHRARKIISIKAPSSGCPVRRQQGFQLALVHAGLRHTVQLDRNAAGKGRPDAVLHGGKLVHGDAPEGLRVQGVKADVHAVTPADSRAGSFGPAARRWW